MRLLVRPQMNLSSIQTLTGPPASLLAHLDSVPSSVYLPRLVHPSGKLVVHPRPARGGGQHQGIADRKLRPGLRSPTVVSRRHGIGEFPIVDIRREAFIASAWLELCCFGDVECWYGTWLFGSSVLLQGGGA